MRENRTKLYEVPLSRGLFGLSLVSLITSTCFIVFEAEDYYIPGFSMHNETFFVVSLILIIGWSINYSLYSDGLVIKLFGIPIRRIPWKRITGAIYFPRQAEGKTADERPCVLITLDPCQTQKLTVNELESFQLKHFRYTIRIRIPKQKEAEFIAVVEQCVGTVLGFEQQK